MNASSASGAAPTAPSSWRKWGGLVILSLALAIIIIDTTLLNVSLKTIIEDLRTDILHLQWVISAYTLTLTALTITGGRMGDFFGRKRMFLLGAILFAIGSFLASVSQSFWTLLLGESIIEGIGAALMMPATSSLLVANFRGRERAVAFGIWGGIAAASSAVGPILGGYLTSTYSWRWGFRINVVVAAVVLLCSWLIPESRDEAEKPSLDWLGVILSAVGLFALVFGFIESSDYGWWTAKQAFSIGQVVLPLGGLSIAPVAVGAGFVLLALFLWWEGIREARGKTPLVSLHLFGNQQFRSSVATMTMLSLGQSGLIFSIPVFLQTVRGLDAFHTGLSLLPLSVMLFVAALLSSQLVRRVTSKRLIQAGLLFNVAAMLLLWMSLGVDTTSWDLAPGLALYGFGMGLIMPQISNLALSAVSVQQAGEASGVNNTLRQLGSTLGAAIIGSVFLTSVASHAVRGIEGSTVIPEQAKAAIAENIRNNASQIEFGGGDARLAELPPALKAEIASVTAGALAEGGRSALLFTDVILILSFLVSLALPNVKDVERGESAVAAGH